jgi:hypothetical protein
VYGLTYGIKFACVKGTAEPGGACGVCAADAGRGDVYV